MVVIDPRKIDQAKRADKWLPVRVGTDIALANAMAHVIIDEALYDKSFVERATENFEAFREKVAEYSPELDATPLGGRRQRVGLDRVRLPQS